MNRINTYTCRACHQQIVTTDHAQGVTAFMLPCKVTPGCQGFMYSAMYRADQTLQPGWEWYKPDVAEIENLPQSVRDHVALGGLLLRKIEGKSNG